MIHFLQQYQIFSIISFSLSFLCHLSNVLYHNSSSYYMRLVVVGAYTHSIDFQFVRLLHICVRAHTDIHMYVDIIKYILLFHIFSLRQILLRIKSFSSSLKEKERNAILLYAFTQLFNWWTLNILAKET